MTARLSRDDDAADARSQFADRGFVQIRDVLRGEDADRLHDCLSQSTPWNLVFNQGGRHFDLDGEKTRALPQDDLVRLESAIYGQARRGFQYYYRNYPIHDAVRAGTNPGHPLHDFYAFLNDERFLGLARAITGCDDISFADAQATCFLPGHFLTEHDDSADGKHRRVAYVFNFTRGWQPDWGGYLQLLDDDGDIRHGLMPAFNALNLVAVPQRHSVGHVAPFACAPRLSVTGWLRAG